MDAYSYGYSYSYSYSCSYSCSYSYSYSCVSYSYSYTQTSRGSIHAVRRKCSSHAMENALSCALRHSLRRRTPKLDSLIQWLCADSRSSTAGPYW